MKRIFSKETSLIAQLIAALALAVMLMILDIHYQGFKTVRYYLDTIISPIFYISNTPSAISDSLFDMSKSRQELLKENEMLKNSFLAKESDLLLLAQLKKENEELRKLLDSPLKPDEYKMVAQVLFVERNPYIHQLVINKGQKDKVYVGQPVVDNKGVIGQISQVSQNTSRVILVCDTLHAIPVKILRNDISMIAVGNGCNNDLLLDFLPNDVDVRVGDVLVTSGLGGNFIEGYPVATVNSVKVNIYDSTPSISAKPIADLKRLRYLLLLRHEGELYEE